MQELYTYQVARIRSREPSLLSRQDIEQLMSAKTYEDCLRILKDKGFSGDSNDILSDEEAKTWDFIKELVGDLSPFEAILLPADYNNLKAAIKLKVTGEKPHKVFKSGITDPQIYIDSVNENDFSALPEDMRSAGEEAYLTLLQTRDGQLCDIILDKACLAAIKRAGEKSENELIKSYCELTVAVSDIKIAVRCVKMGKRLSFIKDALCPCDTLDIEALAAAAAKSQNEVFAYLSLTDYRKAAEEYKKSSSAFEKWCDDKIMELIQSQKSNPFTIGPIIAYILARKNEIGCVRIILSGKQNGLDDSFIRERLRKMYV